ncbi:hypothetical protein K1719_039813 [Acacia pycnantha]|nr:hypothetical protein K1719_039813 [Acacia pycnantha]
METRAQLSKVERYRRRLKYHNKFYVEPVGTGGGLALWWEERMSTEVVMADKNLIHVKIILVLEPVVGYMTLVYGPPKEQHRGGWWRLKELYPGSNVPWIWFGDFNELLYDSEKQGGQMRTLRFQSFMSNCSLVDMGYKELGFTWSNNHTAEDSVHERLDRAICNGIWRNICPNAQVSNLEPLVSDHSPLALHVNEFSITSFEQWLLDIMCALKHDEFSQSFVAYTCWYTREGRCSKAKFLIVTGCCNLLVQVLLNYGELDIGLMIILVPGWILVKQRPYIVALKIEAWFS